MAALIDPVAIIKACGVKMVEIVNPLDLKETVAAVHKVMAFPGVAALVMQSPCAAIIKPKRHFQIDSTLCNNCRRCLRELGCPAFWADDKPQITSSCYGCGLCSQICPSGAIKEVAKD
jgi:indolepyruvate ferredoxin oxidoreductase alpha subunit